MSGDPAGRVSATPGGGAGSQLCVLLACFAGSKSAAKIRGRLGRQITGGGDAILDEVVVTINAKRKVRIYDPRRTAAGTLVPAVTWGVFGLLAGGVRGLGVWAILGAICGGLFAYLHEHLLTKDELKRIGGRLPGNASAIVAFIHGADPRRVVSAAAPFRPTAASAAAISGDLSARVYGGESGPVETSSVPSGGRVPLSGNTMLNMLLLRYRGNHTARQELARASSAEQERRQGVQAELIFEAPEHGRLKVSDPSQGAAAMSRSDVMSWGLFGLLWGAIAGSASNGGVLSSIKSGLVTGILWALFGLVAGALYGLWAGRAVSARRLKGVSPLLPPDTSTVLAWSEGNLTQQVIDGYSAPGSQRLILRFDPVGDGVLLEV